MTETVEAQERQARFYAKHGINMIRQHPVESVLGSLIRDGERPALRCRERLDRLDRWFSILKKNGIYMTWSIFYHHVVLPDEGIDPGLYNELPSQRRRQGHLRPGHLHRGVPGLAVAVRPRVAPEPCQSRTRAWRTRTIRPWRLSRRRNEDSVFFHNPLGDGFVRGQVVSEARREAEAPVAAVGQGASTRAMPR